MAATKGWYWPWLLAAGMSGIVGVNTWMLFAANSDANGVVVEPDYYRKAVQWDSAMARQRESAALGWRATVRLSAVPAAPLAASGLSAPDPTRALEVTLLDGVGAPLTGATVRATLIHNADAGRPVTAVLTELGEGRYAADPRLAHRGMWEVRIEAERSAARFLTSTRAELAPPHVD